MGGGCSVKYEVEWMGWMNEKKRERERKEKERKGFDFAG